MKTRHLFAILIFTFALVFLNINASAKVQEARISGTVIAYNVFSRGWLIIGFPAYLEDHEELIVRVNKSSGGLEKGQYIKLRYSNAANHAAHLPERMLEKSQQWEFKLIRDTDCDESAMKVLYAEGKNGKEPNQSWKRLPGSEKGKIPEDTNLPCYMFGPNDFRK